MRSIDGRARRRLRAIKLKQWKTRWFALEGGALRYFDKRGGPLKGEVLLRGGAVNLADPAEVEGGRRHCIKLVNPTSQIVLQAADGVAATAWAAALYRAVAFANGGSGYWLR